MYIIHIEFILFVSVCYHSFLYLHTHRCYETPKSVVLQLQADEDFDPLTVEPPSMLGLGGSDPSGFQKGKSSRIHLLKESSYQVHVCMLLYLRNLIWMVVTIVNLIYG